MEIEAQIEAFVNDEVARELEFPATFNSYHRMLVHEVAEERGLVHGSKGEGAKRRIVVSKPDIVPEIEEEKKESEFTIEHFTETKPEERDIEMPEPAKKKKKNKKSKKTLEARAQGIEESTVE